MFWGCPSVRAYVHTYTCMCAFVRVRAQAFSDRRAVDFSLVSPAAEINQAWWAICSAAVSYILFIF